MHSIFLDKSVEPTDEALKIGIHSTFPIWKEIEKYIYEVYPKAQSKWNYSSVKLGWSYRISDSKRVLVYLLPRDQFFKVAFVFGQKATDLIMESSVSDAIKNDLKAAKVYAEGRGIRIDISNELLLEDIKKLISIKVNA
jgi:Protein of unknown function (DUF3788)